MFLNSALGHPEPLGDAAVREALRHQREYISLSGGDLLQRIDRTTSSEQLLDQDRVYGGATCHEPVQRGDELINVGDTALEQVTGPFTGGEQVHRMLHLDVRGEDQDGDLRELSPDSATDVETLSGLTGRHADVNDGECRLVPSNGGEQLLGVGALINHLEAGPTQQTRETFAQQHVVFREYHTDSLLDHEPDYGR